MESKNFFWWDSCNSNLRSLLIIWFLSWYMSHLSSNTFSNRTDFNVLRHFEWGVSIFWNRVSSKNIKNINTITIQLQFLKAQIIQKWSTNKTPNLQYAEKLNDLVMTGRKMTIKKVNLLIFDLLNVCRGGNILMLPATF